MSRLSLVVVIVLAVVEGVEVPGIHPGRGV